MPYIFPSASTEKSIGLFLCCFATENPKHQVALLYFFVGVSPFAYTEAVVSRKRRINCAVALSPKAVALPLQNAIRIFHSLFESQ
jgi:hypothetical protein